MTYTCIFYLKRDTESFFYRKSKSFQSFCSSVKLWLLCFNWTITAKQTFDSFVSFLSWRKLTHLRLSFTLIPLVRNVLTECQNRRQQTCLASLGKVISEQKNVECVHADVDEMTPHSTNVISWDRQRNNNFVQVAHQGRINCGNMAATSWGHT